MSSAISRSTWCLVLAICLGSCRHVHSTRWLDDEIEPVEGTRSFQEVAEQSQVRVDWTKLETDGDLIVSTWSVRPGEEEVNFKTRVEQQVTPFHPGFILLKAITLPFYLAFFSPFWGGEDHDLDGEIGVFDKLDDFVAWMNPFQAPPIDGGSKTVTSTVSEGHRKELIYSARPEPFAIVQVELISGDERLGLVLITGPDGTAQMNLYNQLAGEKRPTVHASWDAPTGSVEVQRKVRIR